MPASCKCLTELWRAVTDINHRHFPDNDLMPILGGGKIFRPKAMLVFINPTHANISSNKGWQGPRFPFIGTKQVWRVLHNAGLFDDALMNRINDSKPWSVQFANEVLNHLKANSLYLTNIVKWTGHDATLPDSEKIKLFLPALEKEIEIVQPEYIITFGLIPFNSLTKEKIKLNDYYSDAIKTKRLKYYDRTYGSVKTKIIPCYFPTGRGNPKRAIEILTLFNKI